MEQGVRHDPKISEILSQKSTFCSSSKCITVAKIRPETATHVSEKHRISPISDFHMTRRAVSRRVIPVPGWSTHVMAKIVFRLLGCETLNFSKSVNSFRLAVFSAIFSDQCSRFVSPNRQTNLKRRSFTGPRGWPCPKKFRNFGSKIDILLELKMHHRGQHTPGDGQWCDAF